MLRRLSIRGKVLAALSVPVLVLFALAGTISLQAVEDVRVARTVTQLLGALDRTRDLTSALQAERDVSLAVIGSGAQDSDNRSALEDLRGDTDTALARAETALARADLDVLDPVIQRSVDGLFEQLAEVEFLRYGVDGSTPSIQETFTGYSTAIQRTVAFPDQVADALDDRRLGTIVAAHAQVSTVVEGYRQEQALGREVLAGAQGISEVRLLASLFPSTTVQHDDATATVQQLDLGDNVVVPPLILGLRTYGNARSVATGGEQNFMEFIDPGQWYSSAEEHIQTFEAVDGELHDAAADRSSAVEGSAISTAVLTIAVTLLALVISVAAALAIARQIVNPLRRLTAAAGTVSEELPNLVDLMATPGQTPDLRLTQIPVHSTDEVGQLATAFNEVNATTIHVAQEQAALRGAIAEMFVNVARRDQVLLNRQLSFIDALERSEEDPKTLADLFRLDHLATRMRRNAESLLVLAGIDSGRRLREPLPTSDVIRTASSEIEHYERIQLDLPVDPMMLGRSALPAAHLLAELLENATVFSEPGTPVHVSTGLDDTHVIITVHDEGLGMTTAELESANEKIAKTSAGDVLGSQRLGLFVVGRLATRLGAEVRLGTGPGGNGTLATVRLPQVLFVDSATLPRTAPSQPVLRSQPEPAVLEAAPEAGALAGAGAPAGAQPQDVAPGSLGSAQNPATAVDLGALTDGATDHGLPRRRSRGADAGAPAPSETHRDADDAASASSIPLAPQADMLAGAALGADDEVWTPPVVQDAGPLLARRPVDGAPSAPPAPGAPAVQPTQPVQPVIDESGPALPTRRPSTDAVPTGSALPSRTSPTALPGAEDTAPGLPVRESAGPALPTRQPSASAPAPAPAAGTSPAPDADSRAAMFSGFRSRRAEMAAAAVHVEQREDRREPAEPVGGTPDLGASDGADRLAAAAAGAAAFFTRGGDDQATGGPSAGDRNEDASAQASSDAVDEPAPMVIPTLADDDDYGDPVFAPGAPAVTVDPPAAPRARYRPRHAYPSDEPEPEGTWTPTPSSGVHVYAPLDESPAPQPEPAQPQASTPWVPQLQPEPEDVRAEPWQQVEPDLEPSWEAPAEPPSTVETQAPADDAVPHDAVADVPDVAEPVWPPVQPATPEPAAAVEPTVTHEPAPASPSSAGPLWTPTSGQSATPAPVGGPTGAPSAPADAGFTDHVDGSTTEPQRRERKRGRWFGRKRAARAAESAAPSAPPTEPATPDVPSAGPVRQSAWGGADPGAHALPSSGQPTAPETSSPQPPVFHPEPTPGPGSMFEPGQDVPAQAQWHAPPPPEPTWPAEQTAAPSQDPAWAPQSAWSAPDLPETPAAATDTTAQWAPTPAWDAQQAPAAPSQHEGHQDVAAPQGDVPSPAQPPPGSFRPQTTFTPAPTSGGAFDDQVTNMLAQNADIAQQALAELSQLSSYRPKTAPAGGASTLARRTPGTIPAAPEIEPRKAGQRTDRDADQVRSLLSSFQSGTNRGRQAADSPTQHDPQTAGADLGPTGHEEGTDAAHGEPVTTPDTDLTPRSTSW